MGPPGTVLGWTPDGSGWSRLVPLRQPMWEGCGKPTGRATGPRPSSNPQAGCGHRREKGSSRNSIFLIKSKSTASGGETPRGSAVPGVNVRRSSVRKAPWGRRTAMKDWQSQAHVKWDCKYHVVILPKYRRKVLYGRMRRGMGQILRDLCRQKNIELVEGKAMPDHIHMLLSVPPRYSMAVTIGYLKGKSATRIHG